MREQLVGFVQREYPQYLPRLRAETSWDGAEGEAPPRERAHADGADRSA